MVTDTYGEIARKIADKRGLKTMSAQAVGGAVGHNRVSGDCPLPQSYWFRRKSYRLCRRD